MQTIISKKDLGRFGLIACSLMCLLLVVVMYQPRTARGQELHLRGEAKVKPWSGWWWPKNRGELAKGYNGRPSPAEKYDYYTSGS
jgi:hypothetical protein